ncbi:2TM domain-containing protein [Aureibaculum sp. A20]|uniref:2TM domain-containing protein n=1 Tax=Aureibaculum flavum TaxID=2795986 RepID=A0ABS0WL92_9FLAO|nr:2TM domain-containing protein [Aureibaculum flavum]MBJ2172741.1 2TM domain-containing protein [Aureibaculum flavum]
MSEYRKVIVIGFIIGVVIMIIDMIFRVLSGYSITFDNQLLISFGYYQMYSIVLTIVNSSFFGYLNKIEWKKYGQYRILIGSLGGVVLTMIAIVFLRMFQEMTIKGEGFNEFYTGELSNGRFYFTCVIITIVASIFFHAVYFYQKSQKEKVTEQKIIAGTASAQFDALKNQLDPHFLFNSLNVLTSLIDENPDAAQKFTTALSKVYRYVLEQKNKELISVDEELQFAKTYVSLLKMRFEDSIIFSIPDKASNSEAKVIPLALQLLLENAVKHNVVNSKNPLTIKIYEQEGHLVVENNLQTKAVLKKSSGVGLTNIQQRYQLLTDRKVSINKTEGAFIVKLPMLTKQISVMQTQENYIEDKRYLKAKERVEKIKAFYSNLTSYLIVIPILAYINFRGGGGFPWVIFPALGWGFGLLMHGMETYGYNPLLGKDWEDRKVREFMDKE